MRKTAFKLLLNFVKALTFSVGLLGMPVEPGLNGGPKTPDIKPAIHIGPAAFSPDGKYVVAGFSLGKWNVETPLLENLLVWDVATGILIRSLPGQKGGTRLVAFSPDAQLIYSLDRTGVCRVWDPVNAKIVRTFSTEEKLLCQDIHPEKKLLYTAGFDDVRQVLKLKLWDLTSGKVVEKFRLRGGVSFMRVSPDGNCVFFGNYSLSTDDIVSRIFDLVNDRVIVEFKAYRPHGSYTAPAAFSPDNKRVFSGKWVKKEFHLVLWDAATGKEVQQVGRDSELQTLAFTPDGNNIITLSVRGDLRRWDLGSGKLLWKQEIREPDQDLNNVAFSKDAKLAFVSKGNSTPFTYPGVIVAEIWDAMEGKKIRTLNISKPK